MRVEGLVLQWLFVVLESASANVRDRQGWKEGGSVARERGREGEREREREGYGYKGEET